MTINLKNSENGEDCAKCAFKTSVGGQALMEGVMMRGPQKVALAVRKPDGEIYKEVKDVKVRPWRNWVFVRGVLNFADTLIDGYKYLMKSAEVSMDEEGEAAQQSKFDKWVSDKFGEKGMNFMMAIAAVLGGCLALVLFMILPTLIVTLIELFIPLGGFKTIVEGIIKIVILVSYMAAVSKVPDIARVFGYHGAEHKTISCYEAGEELTVENVRKYPCYHPRCGTSFMLIVIVISIIVASALPWGNTIVRIALKLVTLPIVVAISYEIIKLCGRYDNVITRIISVPGMWLQHITTNEPDDSMIECAIEAVLPVLPEKKEDGSW